MINYSKWGFAAGLLGAILYLLTATGAIPPSFAAIQGRALATTPANFVDELITGVGSPTAMAFTPDGRLLITTQTGALHIYQNGALLTTPALNLATVLCSNFERGLLGIGIDPNFAANNYIYLYYTFNKHNSCPQGQPSSTLNPVNRVSRFTLPTGNVIDKTTELVLVDNIPSKNGNHNGGDLHFGADDFLYISIGDSGAESTVTYDVSHLAGKILRVNSNGTYPATNPYGGANGVRRCGDPAGVPAGSGPCGEVFAYGLRNPFRFAFRPGSSQFYINDVGQNLWEEIDEGSIGADYGWCQREGPAAYTNGNAAHCKRPGAPTLIEPLYVYNHATGCYSITGGAFVPAGLWPASYDNAYLFADYGCGKIMQLSQSTPYSASDFVTGLGSNSATAMIFGPYNSSQALYYLTYNTGGQVRRVRYTGTVNRPPTAVLAANPASGLAPLKVNFNAAGSSDPDAGDTLTYLWNFGDGQSTTSSTQTISHTFMLNGIYTATLIVRDNHNATSTPATARIDVGNSAPVPLMLSPAVNAQFSVGQQIRLQGSATDVEDGALDDTALSWQVFLHHIDAVNPGNAHTHPLLSETLGNDIPINGVDMEDLAAAALSYLEVRLTATDSAGLATTITRTVQPRRVNLTFLTEPDGLTLSVRAVAFMAPRTLVSWANARLELIGATQTISGTTWYFSNWSDGGAATHTLITPANAFTYTAAFTQTVPLTLTPTPTTTVTPAPTLTATVTLVPTAPTATPICLPGEPCSKTHLPVIRK